jgi:hypothetical protein
VTLRSSLQGSSDFDDVCVVAQARQAYPVNGFNEQTRRNLKNAIVSVCLMVGSMALCACIAPTPYQSKGYHGGFSETQLSENVFEVYFRGNGVTSEERAEDFTLLRSAEVASTHGYPYFIIVDEKSGASYATITTPTTTTTTGSGTVTGNTVYGQSTSTTYGGNSFLIRKPSKRNTIVCFKEKPEVQGLVYESAFIMQSIEAKYGMHSEKK